LLRFVTTLDLVTRKKCSLTWESVKHKTNLLHQWDNGSYLLIFCSKPCIFGGNLFNPKTSVEWGLKCVDFYFRQGTMRRTNALLQRIVTQQKLKSGVL
jgi:hypothetical protein